MLRKFKIVYKIYTRGDIMLRKIKINNICSIKFAEMDLEKGNYQYESNNVLVNVVNPIALYGHNGSGKSSFLNAIKQFIDLMINPIESLSPFIVNNVLFNRYNSNPKNEEDLIGSIEFEFDINDKDYLYYLSTSRKGAIILEYLKEGNEYIYKRNTEEYIYKNESHSLQDISSLVPTIRYLASKEINDITIQYIYAYLSSFTHVDLQYLSRGGFITSKSLTNNNNIYDLLVSKSNQVKSVLKEYKNFPFYSIKKTNSIGINGVFLNNYYVEIEDGDFKMNLPFNMVSTGMKNNSILLSILFSLPHNGVLFVDELEIALHPSAIEVFLSIVKRNQIQLIFSSHNTNILQYLRPDQVYFAKWKKGFSTIVRLSNIYPNIREVNNIEKMYLNSIFDEAINKDEQ